MADYSNRMYVIGDRETGVLFIRLDPLRVSILTRKDIEDYAGAGNFDATFNKIGRQGQSFMNRYDNAAEPEYDTAVDNAVEALLGRRAAITDAEFCFISDMKDTAWLSDRIPWPLAHDSLANLQDKRPTGAGKTYQAKPVPPVSQVAASNPAKPAT